MRYVIVLLILLPLPACADSRRALRDVPNEQATEDLDAPVGSLPEGRHYEVLTDSSDGGELKSLVTANLLREACDEFVDARNLAPERDSTGRIVIRTPGGVQVLLIDDHTLRKEYQAEVKLIEATKRCKVLIQYECGSKSELIHAFFVLIDGATGKTIYVLPAYHINR